MQSLKDVLRNAVAVFVVLAIVSLLTHNSSNAAANKSTAPVRGYYLTTGTYDGSQATTACTAGYHMASLWEIHEPANLRYDTALGVTITDSGGGPPSISTGWVRTGWGPDNASIPGTGNCDAYTSTLGAGTLAGLPHFWTDPPEIMSPWHVNTDLCSVQHDVWCVQD